MSWLSEEMKEVLGCLLEPSANSAVEPCEEHQQQLSHQRPERVFCKSLPSQGYVQHYTGIVSCLPLSSLMKLVLIVQEGSEVQRELVTVT